MYVCMRVGYPEWVCVHACVCGRGVYARLSASACGRRPCGAGGMSYRACATARVLARVCYRACATARVLPRVCVHTSAYVVLCWFAASVHAPGMWNSARARVCVCVRARACARGCACERVSVSARAYECAEVRVRARVCVCARACARVRACVRACTVAVRADHRAVVHELARPACVGARKVPAWVRARARACAPARVQQQQ
jgi:hypothetical protein